MKKTILLCFVILTTTINADITGSGFAQTQNEAYSFPSSSMGMHMLLRT